MSTTIKAANVKLKRAYDPPESADGVRILVDRLWPRGVKKDNAAIDQWMKEVAPSADLRKWFGHDPERWDEFYERYAKEVSQQPDQLQKLRELARKGPITLVYSAHDEAHNNAIALKDMILGRGKARQS
ncbi:DUF488 domain-containing protein [Nitrosovibrio tenuis]|uniref:Uncharacterized conserved protein YeaO, DUF488 family n=1 Tax=Nitrosovibrio tenuis TaxID=1233 RepID=A0A1H7NTE8_9PROT|nr:DUF488 domain-containing protein [Nitrosovibrio tenuis]SEL26285.1 Uncharacterized conserved protein YeaO, DUF488 family [Nitrosovibrio tenuis]